MLIFPGTQNHNLRWYKFYIGIDIKFVGHLSTTQKWMRRKINTHVSHEFEGGIIRRTFA